VVLVLELVAVLWFEFMSVEAVVVVAGAAADGAALLSRLLALVCELTGGVALLAVVAALLPGAAAVWSVVVDVAGAAVLEPAASLEVAGALDAEASLEVAGAAAAEAEALSSLARGSFFGGWAALAAVLLSDVESCEVTV